MKRFPKGLLALGAAVVGAAAASTAVIGHLFRLAAGRKLPLLSRGALSSMEELRTDNPYADEIESGTQWLLSQTTETVTITSRDGLTLTGHYLPAPNAERTLLLMHGWRSSWFRDFGVGARYFHENGCNVLLAEQRSHGESDGEYIGFGILERYDCADWVNWIIEHRGGDLPIYLDGLSMGATTVLMASGLDLPEAVRGIIADCGFTSPKEIMEDVLGKYVVLGKKPTVAAADILCRHAAGYSFSEYSTVDALRSNTRPVLFIHGTADDFVPPEMSFRNFAACRAPKELLIVNGAEHGMSYLVRKEPYQQLVQRFFQRYDKPSGKEQITE